MNRTFSASPAALAVLAAALAAMSGCAAKHDVAAETQEKARMSVESRIETIQRSPMPPEAKQKVIASLRAQTQAPAPAAKP